MIHRLIGEDEQAVWDIRKLVIDCCRQNGGGHGGSAIGMAPLAVSLWKHVMRYNSSNPDWYDRDRFVLSSGHACLLLYVMLYLTGYPKMTLEQLRLYADPGARRKDVETNDESLCPGHPEIDIPGVEITTGPLGQGIANAVGMAIAAKQQAALYNKPDCNIISSTVYCVTGDACLQEGVALEAIAVAGNLGLDNLVLCYDNNAVTCDGPLEWTSLEDINGKMRASGWEVIDVQDGDTSVEEITAALKTATSGAGKPYFVNIRTTIGFGTSTADSNASHHGNYSESDAVRWANGMLGPHEITESTREAFSSARSRGTNSEIEWNQVLENYSRLYPKDFMALKSQMEGKLEYKRVLESLQVPADLKATRESSGYVFSQVLEQIPSIFGLSADLARATKMGTWPDITLQRDRFTGRVVRVGIREHAMAAIANGMAAYSHQAFIPVTATFFMFYLYAAAGVRMGALSRLKVIHIATHDSVGEGQNGPTHQPVEVDSLYRAMPSLLYIRPADAEEVVGAWMVALGAEHTPSIMSLARDPSTHKLPNTDRFKVADGGYVVDERVSARVTLVSSGSELQFACNAATVLTKEGIITRVVSMPCIRLFEKQSEEYKDQILSNSPHVISVEPFISTIWARYCTASIAMNGYGHSASGVSNYARFGLDTEGIVRKVKAHLLVWDRNPRRRAVNWTLLEE